MAKILILSCKGGGGHMSAAAAIQSCLEEHEVEVVDFLGDTLAPVDFFRWFSFGKIAAQDFYNFLLRINAKRLTNLLYHGGWFLFWLQRKFIKKALKNLFEEKTPDLVISVIPMINGPIAGEAQKKNVPFLLIPTDLDLRSFTAGLNKSNNMMTWLGLGFMDNRITSFVSYEVISPSKLQWIGFPIRAPFTAVHDKNKLLSLFQIPPGKSVILLIMGATGSTSLISYMKALSLVRNLKLHILVCLGRSSAIASRIKAISMPPGISYTLLDSSANISQAMAVSDLCISKPGSVTFCETIYSSLPVFLDATGPILIWEAFNLGFVRRNGNGRVITAYEQVPRLVAKFFTDGQWRSKLEENVRTLEKKVFSHHLPPLINKIVGQQK